MNKEDFLKITTHNELASMFGMSYAKLTKIIYKTDGVYKYHQFQIPKKNGGHREIASPSKKLKKIQSELKELFYEIYPSKPSAHGFAKNKSIVTNAERHLDKRFIFNIDLSNFFGSIHFGRIRNLFKSSPFNFNNSIATILAQICCFDNSLPQGAPTSPILSNMIAWKLDTQLQSLAKMTNGTYTRYADDISFSFTTTKGRLPEEIVILRGGEAAPGHALTHIIEENGFFINYDKVRLCSRLSRMEVTGLTVNELTNVRRKYVRQLSSMLHAWRKHGYELAEKDFNEKYDTRYRASGKPKSFLHVVKGKLAFLRSVKTERDPIYIKLATQFNDLVTDEHKFKIKVPSDPEKNAINALWVIEACYDNEEGEAMVPQGSGFQLEDIGIVTCAHVVSEKGKIFEDLEAFKHDDSTVKYKLRVERICSHRDIAICSLLVEEGKEPPKHSVSRSANNVEMGQDVKLLGFPAYAPGHSYFMVDTKVAKIYTQSLVRKFEINALIREGNSGGPIIDSKSSVVGIALEGARKEAGNNGCLTIPELEDVLSDDKYKI
ncbi:reverse transcriptase domain-containing protein [Nitrosococcus wardiae]|uniref:RNA-directed DNA polymerase n=1 Tax=Nitrosococcus wardiae TaxID=1814290 RepID=A0A4P7C4U5_9GAMM|nr:reverse transcriptase domain-containing protein [Nitrosococcus wardiae]QBQ55832.1 Retron-type RNA-directed DNA polymerase [Nitrosococcus wardiae]